MSEKPLDPPTDVDKIAALLEEDPVEDLVILVIPSHDKGKNPINNQDMWANEALNLFADMYTGATAFGFKQQSESGDDPKGMSGPMRGIYKTNEGEILLDAPILVESFASNSEIQNRANLTKLVELAKRMGRDTKQDCVMLVFGTVKYYIEEFADT